MNSPNKLYEELLKEHPELKNSQENIPEIILSLKKLNPSVQIDQDFKMNLKTRLDTIANYNPSKGSSYFGFLKYLVPVFTFGFAIFGFVYFSQDFEQSVQQEIGGFEPELLMMKMSDIPSLEILDENNENIEGNQMMLRGTIKGISKESVEGNNEEINGEVEVIEEETIILQSEPDQLRINQQGKNIKTMTDTTTDDLSDEILDEITPMLFSMPMGESTGNNQGGLGDNTQDEMIEEIFQDLSESIIGESESTEIESSAIKMMISEEHIDEFRNICLDSNGLMKDLGEGERICILEKVNCLESDFKLEKCLIEK